MNELNIIVPVCTALLMLIYFIFGLGVGRAEKKANSHDEIRSITVFIWPVALVCFCFGVGL